MTPPPFSSRTAWSRDTPALTEARHRAEARGPLVDLCASNPTTLGFAPSPTLLEAWAAPAGATYAPASFGLPSAREAVAAYYAARGASVPIDRIGLAASSSEIYGWLLALLCDPGDAVLAARPSYPLVPMLAQLAGVRVVDYPLLRDERWRPDLGAVARALEADPSIRAIVMVHPNNPTGSLLRPDDAAALAALAATHGAALVVDEVFLDYRRAPDDPTHLGTFTAGAADAALWFVISGLSKVALLPQAKLSWWVAGGPRDAVTEACARLELVADTYLSVSSAVQHALPAALEHGDGVRAALMARLDENLARLDAALEALGPARAVTRQPLVAGWYVLLDVPRVETDEAWCLALLEEGIAVQPGYFYDIEERGTLVVGLLQPPARFGPAVDRMLRVLSA